MQEYYDRRAPEYDDWYLGAGLFAERDRPGWRETLGGGATIFDGNWFVAVRWP